MPAPTAVATAETMNMPGIVSAAASWPPMIEPRIVPMLNAKRRDRHEEQRIQRQGPAHGSQRERKAAEDEQPFRTEPTVSMVRLSSIGPSPAEPAASVATAIPTRSGSRVTASQVAAAAGTVDDRAPGRCRDHGHACVQRGEQADLGQAGGRSDTGPRMVPVGRAIAWLAVDDPVVSAALSGPWQGVLAGYVPEPFRNLG
jgi:hypothetical protein